MSTKKQIKEDLTRLLALREELALARKAYNEPECSAGRIRRYNAAYEDYNNAYTEFEQKYLKE
jgi:hypothetical protein